MKLANTILALLLFCNVASLGFVIHEIQSYPVPEPMLWLNLLGCVVLGYWLKMEK